MSDWIRSSWWKEEKTLSEMIGTTELAKLTGLKESELRACAKAGFIPHSFVGGKLVFNKEEALAAIKKT